MTTVTSRAGENNPTAKLTATAVTSIREAVAAGATLRSQARRYGVSETCVSSVVTGRTWPYTPGPLRPTHHRGYPDRRGTANPCAVLTETNIVNLRTAHAAGTRQADLARTYGISESAVSKIVRGTSWTHVGGPRKPP